MVGVLVRGERVGLTVLTTTGTSVVVDPAIMSASAAFRIGAFDNDNGILLGTENGMIAGVIRGPFEYANRNEIKPPTKTTTLNIVRQSTELPFLSAAEGNVNLL